MPPFKPNSIASAIIQKRKPQGGFTSEADAQPEQDEMPDDNIGNQEDDGLSSCASDLIAAVHAGDEAGVASALRAAFQVLESQPHDEYEDEGQE